MKGTSKTTIATATAKNLTKRRPKSYTAPNYQVDVHISANNLQNNYNTKKGRK